MDTLDYQIGMLIKKQMYQHAGKRLISVYPRDLPRLHELLSAKLALLGRTDSASASPKSERHPDTQQVPSSTNNVDEAKRSQT